MNEPLQYDDFFRKRLGEHEAEVPRDLFDRLMEERAAKQPEFDAIFKEKLTAHSADVPSDAFDTLMRKREWQHNPIYGFFKRALGRSEAAVPVDMFERIMDARVSARPAAWWQKGHLRWGMALLLLLSLAAGGYYWMTEKSETQAPNNQPVVFNNDKKEDIYLNTQTNSRHFNQSENAKLTEETPKNAPITEGGVKSNTSQLSAGIQKNRYFIHKNQTSNPRSEEARRDKNSDFQTTPPVTFKEEPKGTLTKTEAHSAQSAIADARQNSSPLAYLNLLNASELPVKAFNPCAGPGDGCPTFGRQLHKGFGDKTWYIDAYGAPELSMRTLRLRTAEGEALLRARDTTEAVLMGLSAGVRASLVFENGLALRAGTAYTVHNERYQQDSIARQEILRIDRATGELLGIDIIETTFRKTRYNKYRSFDLMLQAGYEVPVNDFLTVSINGGANLNYLSAKRVRFQTAIGSLDSVIHTFGETSPAVFQNTWGVSLMGSVAAYAHLSNHWQLLVEPQVRYYLRPLTLGDYPLSQRYVNVGLNVGLRYRF